MFLVWFFIASIANCVFISSAVYGRICVRFDCVCVLGLVPFSVYLFHKFLLWFVLNFGLHNLLNFQFRLYSLNIIWDWFANIRRWLHFANEKKIVWREWEKREREKKRRRNRIMYNFYSSMVTIFINQIFVFVGVVTYSWSVNKLVCVFSRILILSVAFDGLRAHKDLVFFPKKIHSSLIRQIIKLIRPNEKNRSLFDLIIIRDVRMWQQQIVICQQIHSVRFELKPKIIQIILHAFSEFEMIFLGKSC